jgi:hypothetical protein
MATDMVAFPGWIRNVLHHANKKADVAEHPMVFGHVGLLVNTPPGKAGLLFI